MESQPPNTEFRINPENFHRCLYNTPHEAHYNTDLDINNTVMLWLPNF